MSRRVEHGSAARDVVINTKCRVTRRARAVKHSGPAINLRILVSGVARKTTNTPDPFRSYAEIARDHVRCKILPFLFAIPSVLNCPLTSRYFRPLS